ncbi:MAG TPA: HEAT repeat domain-containing protein, partial [Pyrinomonadaceae bacterium]|nr:HEAT repeat domain-containing protein [Pyrinomonadaceae bacterium]
MSNRTILLVLICILALSSVTFAQSRTPKPVPAATLLLITKAEDERRWDDELRKFFSDPNAAIRRRAALAAGRIGNEASVTALTGLLEKDNDPGVRSMAVFALGEIESVAGADTLLAILKNTDANAELTARAFEALGKIASALPRDQEARQRELGAAILNALKAETLNQQTILFGLTAALRARPAGAGPVIAKFLAH